MSIIIDHLNYVYSVGTAYMKHAVRDVSLTLKAGEFIGLIGHTGSGKSTLIQHLNGLLKPTSGSVYFHGADIFDDDYDRKTLRTKVGLVFQYPEHQLFETTVQKDVEFGPRNQGLSNLEVNLRAFDALKQVGIGDELLDASPHELSGGQKRRVAIAGVLAMQPEVLILDEPTAGLDPKGRDEILDRIAQIHETRGITIILVSHSMEDVAKYVGRILVMNQGQVVFDAPPREVFMQYQELEKIGLSAPQATYCIEALKRYGLKADGTATTVAEAKQLILTWWNNRNKAGEL